jgi:hypothetical protein
MVRSRTRREWDWGEESENWDTRKKYEIKAALCFVMAVLLLLMTLARKDKGCLHVSQVTRMRPAGGISTATQQLEAVRRLDIYVAQCSQCGYQNNRRHEAVRCSLLSVSCSFCDVWVWTTD